MLRPIITDGLNRTAFFCFLATGLFLRIFRLLENEGVTAVIVPLKIVWRGLPAKIAINALVIHEEFARKVFRIPVCDVSHRSSCWRKISPVAGAMAIKSFNASASWKGQCKRVFHPPDMINRSVPKMLDFLSIPQLNPHDCWYLRSGNQHG